MDSIENEVLETNDINRIYRLKLDLTATSSRLYKSIHIAQSENEKVDLKVELSRVNALLEIIKDRKSSVADRFNSINYNFKQAAKLVLPKEKFLRISELSEMTRKEVKGMKEDLILERLV